MPQKTMTMKSKPHGLTGKPSNRLGTGIAPETRTRSLRLPVSLWEAVEAQAAEDGTTVNRIVREALERQCRAERPA